MNRKQFVILLVLLVVLGVASVIVYEHNSSSWKPAPAAGKVLGDFQINDVAKLVIQTGSATLTIEKKNDEWVVPARDDYPADFARVGEFIQSLWNLKPTEDVQAGPSQLGRLELLPPGKGDGAGILLDLQDKDSKRLAALILGKRQFRKSPQFPNEEGYPVGRYVMPADSSPPKISLVSEIFEQADPTPSAWLDKSFLQIDRIQSVALDSGTNRWSMSRDAETTNDWKLAGIKPGEKLDQTKIPAFTAILSSPGFNDVMSGTAAAKAVFDSTVTVTTFDQLTYVLKFGKADGDNIPMMFSVTSNPPTQRTPGKDETPDQKKQLDEAFAANAKHLAEALARTKKFETRVYLVSKEMFNPLFMTSADMMAGPSAPAPGTPPSPLAPLTAPAPSALPVATKPAPSPSSSPKATPKKSKSPS